MKITEIIDKPTTITTDILCDCCGLSCKKEQTYEYMTLYANWGYESSQDGILMEAHICEKCTIEKLNFIKFNKKKIL